MTYSHGGVVFGDPLRSVGGVGVVPLELKIRVLGHRCNSVRDRGSTLRFPRANPVWYGCQWSLESGVSRFVVVGEGVFR